ncbi:MAG TPA: 8-oxoguanine deaminase [bacterium]|jgi:cytosine/adenosine deaminase-related metal-dependent hydrolase
MAGWLLKNLEAVFEKNGSEQAGVDLLIEGKRVAKVGKDLPQPEGARVLDCRGKVALPGLVNTHHHFFQTLTRCLPAAQNSKLFDWLRYHYGVWRFVNAEAMRAAARLAIGELLLTGCTTTSDHCYLFPQGMADDPLGIDVDAAQELGIRFCGTRGSMTMGKSQGGLPPEELIEEDDHVLRHSEEVIRRWHNPAECSMCQIHLAPCTPFNVTERLLRETALLARQHKVRLHTHLAETLDETDFCLRKFGKRPLALMEDLGWVGEDVWFAHGVHFNDSELDTLSKTGCGIAHCPSSNMRLGSGVARVPDMLARGMTVGLAVDGSASNDSSDMLGELRQAMLLGRVMYGASALSAHQVISLATEHSARLLGRTDFGTLQSGKAADIALFDLEQLSYAGAGDPIAALLFCGGSHRAWAVMVNGEFVVKDGQLVRGDEEQIRRDAVMQAKALRQRAGL